MYLIILTKLRDLLSWDGACGWDDIFPWPQQMKSVNNESAHTSANAWGLFLRVVLYAFMMITINGLLLKPCTNLMP